MWWQTDDYNGAELMPIEFKDLAGPYGTATVRAFASGKTDPGWGLSSPKGLGFMDNYKSGQFNFYKAEVGWVSARWHFAFVMRAFQMVCIDIDGKNNGFANAGKLGLLPETRAETSKSGNGYHLFYSTPWDVWDEDKGFAMFKDRIALYEGIDIRAVGCVYHTPGQKWNDRAVAELPEYLKDKWLTDAEQEVAQSESIRAAVAAKDPDTLLVIQGSLEHDLKKPIPPGRRNTTLFAIGSKMMLSGYPGWDDKVYKRALAAGLDQQEAGKIVANIKRYGAATTP